MGTLPNGVAAPIKPEVQASQPAQVPIGQSRSPLIEFLKREAAMSGDDYRKNMMDQYGDAGSFGNAGLGGDSAVSGALQAKMKQHYADQLGLKKGAFERNLTAQYANKQGKAQEIADMDVDRQRTEELIRAQAEAAAKARRKGLVSSALGLAGGIGGAVYGGPAGAMIGAGAGQMAGGMIDI